MAGPICRTLLLLAVVVGASPAMASTPSTDDGAKLCCEFVRHSVSLQRGLGERVKEANGRQRLFDADAWSGRFEKQVTADNIRYKTGVLNGSRVDAVLSESAQRTVAGETGCRLYLEWLGPQPGVHTDQFGVYI